MSVQQVESAWPRIGKWLAKHAPDGPEHLKPGASADSIAKLEQAIGQPLSDDLKASLRMHSGGGDPGGLPSPTPRDAMAYVLLSIEEILDAYNTWKELVEGGDFADRKAEPDTCIRGDWYHLGWIPVASNGGGDYICVDMSPAGGGTPGQVIAMWHDSEKRRLLAPSLGQYLHNLASDMDAGRCAWLEATGIVLVPKETRRAQGSPLGMAIAYGLIVVFIGFGIATWVWPDLLTATDKDSGVYRTFVFLFELAWSRPVGTLVAIVGLFFAWISTWAGR
ncbi:MAG: hypothetical protein GC159_07785 [Phycisphaera sp.]|nr:hypothetical protein [Phycisphaera sp.]